MLVGRVVGSLVSTQKDAGMEGMKLLVVEQTDMMGNPKGSHLVAVDAVGAGEGELVLYASGSSARQTGLTREKPVDAVIMGIIDSITVRGEVIFSKDF
jgi:microcompartment protein CcmK/EutM